MRRISSDRKGGRFVGSDLYFKDLQERKPSKDRHRLYVAAHYFDGDARTLGGFHQDHSLITLGLRTRL